jgi:hypothetical protein
VSPVRFSPSSLTEGRWYEYLIRFALGGAATVFTGLVSSRYGAFIGGLFLALPAIFCATATLIEKHEICRKREAGLAGERRGQMAAAVDSAGAALGAIGMQAFAIVFSFTAETSIAAALTGCIVCLAGCRGGGLVRTAQGALSAESADRTRRQRLVDSTRAAEFMYEAYQAAVEAFALTPLRSATVLSLVFAAFSSFRLVVRKRTISWWPSSSAQAINVP